MPTSEVAQLSELDHIEIRQLYAKYCFAVDLGDGAMRAAVFTPDGSFKGAANDHRPESVQAMSERTAKQGNIGRRHLITNIVITPSPEGATGRAYALILQRPKEDASALVGHVGVYDDTLVRTADGWRFSTRVFWRDSDAELPFGFGAPPTALPWQA